MTTASFPLACEQRSMLHLDRVLGPGIQHNLIAELQVPPDRTPHQIEAALEQLGTWHPALLAQVCSDDPERQHIGSEPIALEHVLRVRSDGVGGRRDILRARRLDRTKEARACAELHRPQGDGPARLLLAFDHMVCDGQARATLLRDLALLFDGGAVPTRGEGRSGRSALECYCTAQEQQITSGDVHARESANWSRTLDGCTPPSGLSNCRNAEDPWRAAVWQGEWFDGRPHRSVTRLHASYGSTAFVAVSAMLALALWRRTDITASALITPISTRRSPEFADLVTNMISERPIAYRIDPTASVSSLVRQIGGNCLRAIKDSRLAIPDISSRVPGFGAFFDSPGGEYIQIQVELGEGNSEATGHDRWTPAGLYSPDGDATCTTVRVHVAPDATRVRAFYGGPTGGGGWVPELAQDLVKLLSAVNADPEIRIGQLAR